MEKKMSGRETNGIQAGQQRPGPENREGADKATQENNLSTGHSDPDDGGADNAEPDKSRPDKH
jgi:hypothetical protein